MLKSVKIGIVLILVMMGLSLYFYPLLPSNMAVHWNTEGSPNGYSPKIVGLMLIPSLSIGLLILFILIPKIDPLARNMRRFWGYYEMLVVVVTGFMLYMHMRLIAWNMGLKFDMGLMTMPAIGLLFVYLGVLLKHAKRNWFIGIRTPWTLSDEKVWNKTHELGSRLFIVGGVMIALSPSFGKIAIYVVVSTLFLITTFLFVYSYWLWSKLRK